MFEPARGEVVDSGTIIGVVSAVSAVAAAVVSWLAARQSAQSSVSQQRLATHAAGADWLRDLREWASEAIDVLSQAAYACRHHDAAPGESSEELRSCRHRLSALVDRGRFFLPNQQTEEVGAQNPTAYRGYRHTALDPLVAAERVVGGEIGAGKYATREVALVAMRKEFVSAIQQILAPDLHNQEIARMIREGNVRRASDGSLGGLLPNGPAVTTGADRLLFDAAPPGQAAT